MSPEMSEEIRVVWRPAELKPNLQDLEIRDAQVGRQEFIERAAVRSITLPPDGQSTSAVTARVIDEGGRPVRGVNVRFYVDHKHPRGVWRTVAGMIELYVRNRCDNPERIRRLIRSGHLRILGTVAPSTVVTDENGEATAVYRVSHIGGDYDQQRPAVERVVATVADGQCVTTDVEVAHADFVEVTEIVGGLRMVSAVGKHTTNKVRQVLNLIAKQIKESGWKYPMTLLDASLKWGGVFPPHVTHIHGLSLDIRPMSSDGESTWVRRSGEYKKNYDREKTRTLIDRFKAAGACIIYFNDPEIDGVIPLRAHDDHFHVRWIDDKGNYYDPVINVGSPNA